MTLILFVYVLRCIEYAIPLYILQRREYCFFLFTPIMAFGDACSLVNSRTSLTLEPNDILYFFNYQIKYVLLFVI